MHTRRMRHGLGQSWQQGAYMAGGRGAEGHEHAQCCGAAILPTLPAKSERGSDRGLRDSALSPMSPAPVPHKHAHQIALRSCVLSNFHNSELHTPASACNSATQMLRFSKVHVPRHALTAPPKGMLRVRSSMTLNCMSFRVIELHVIPGPCRTGQLRQPIVPLRHYPPCLLTTEQLVRFSAMLHSPTRPAAVTCRTPGGTACIRSP